jgi:hypothetical protein
MRLCGISWGIYNPQIVGKCDILRIVVPFERPRALLFNEALTIPAEGDRQPRLILLYLN